MLTPDSIRALMERHGFKNVRALQTAAGVGHPALYNFFNGKSDLSVDVRAKLAKQFPGDELALVADIVGVA